MEHYTDHCHKGWLHKGYELRDPDPFIDELRFVEMERGDRSGAWSWWESTKDGTMYCVTLSEMKPFILNTNGGNVYGRFGFRKKGANFTLTWLNPEDDF